VITVWYALPTVAGGKCADIAIGCAGLLLALEGVPTFSEEHAQQLDYIDNLRVVAGNRLPDGDDGKSERSIY
jgi:hypothetical protein